MTSFGMKDIENPKVGEILDLVLRRLKEKQFSVEEAVTTSPVVIGLIGDLKIHNTRPQWEDFKEKYDVNIQTPDGVIKMFPSIERARITFEITSEVLKAYDQSYFFN